ncbi:hypothetical protein PSET11_01117 [Arthrobacter ulcerisalmonis]|uniref:Uncharacterized protein n=1 Tax=Arthrobacter ulcerisalmonis TaxID=2483813 RepID=A0A3P5WV37_9MICC|nr:hypothetical protein [Arthrobacter ulcerisalmonis]VDC23021.1 hypothetical protein PSET11_01117 [Arthrobacter ulcerisalmonis]
MTLGSFWGLLARSTRWWLALGTVSVVVGTGLSALALTELTPRPAALLPALGFSLGGGYAVLFPGLRTCTGGVRIHRGWTQHPLAGRVLYISSLILAVAGLAACIATGIRMPDASKILVWLVMGLYLALVGWSAAVIGAAARFTAVRNAATSEAHAARPAVGVTAPTR